MGVEEKCNVMEMKAVAVLIIAPLLKVLEIALDLIRAAVSMT